MRRGGGRSFHTSPGGVLSAVSRSRSRLPRFCAACDRPLPRYDGTTGVEAVGIIDGDGRRVQVHTECAEGWIWTVEDFMDFLEQIDEPHLMPTTI